MKNYYEEAKENHNSFGYGLIGDFPQHFHSSIEFGYILSGSEKVMIESDEKILTKGSAMLVLLYQSHGYEKVSDGEKFLFIVPSDVMNTPEIKHSGIILSTPFFSYSGKDLECMDSMILPLISQIKKCGDTVPINGHSWYTELIRAIILFHIEHTGYSRSAPQATEARLIQRIMSAVDSYYDDHNFSAKTASKMIGISQQYLSSIVRQQTGHGFNEHLRELRLTKSRRLLQDTTKNIAEVVLESGFASICTFNRVFAESVGTTPREYREDIEKHIL